MTRKIPLLGERGRLSSAVPGSENQSSGTPPHRTRQSPSISQKQNFPRHVLLLVETWIYSISVEFGLTSHLLRQEEMFGPVTASGIFKAVVEADAAVVDAVTSVDIVNVTLSDDVSISPNG